MKRLLLIITAAILSITAATAQNTLLLCGNYDADGNGTEVFNEWTITPEAGYIYILYKQPANLRSGIWYLYIDKDWDNNGKFAPYETIAITPETTKNWHVHDFNFTEAGKYKAYMMLDGVVQGSTYFELFMDGAASSGVTTTTTTGVTTDYYEAADIIFCQAIDDKGQLTGISSQYYLGSKGSADVMVYLSNSGLPFKAKTLYVEVYDSETYETLYDYDIEIEEDWDWVKFQQTFTTPGEYYFEVYTSDYIYVTTSGAVIIK